MVVNYFMIQYLNNLEPINQLEWNEDLKIKFDYNNINFIDKNLNTDRKYFIIRKYWKINIK